MVQPTTGRHWAFTKTIRNDEDMNFDYKSLVDRGIASYVIVGLEEASNLHHQGYVCFVKKYSEFSARRLLNNAYVAPIISTPAKNRAYCMKDGNYQEYGDFSLAEHKQDLDVVLGEVLFRVSLDRAL